MLKTTYDPEAEAIYMFINKAKIEKTLSFNDLVQIDLDIKENIVGIEVLGVSNGLIRHFQNIQLLGSKNRVAVI